MVSINRRLRNINQRINQITSLLRCGTADRCLSIIMKFPKNIHSIEIRQQVTGFVVWLAARMCRKILKWRSNRFLTSLSKQTSVGSSNMLISIESLHEAACRSQQTTYLDPISGYIVMTSYGHQKRGKCCGNRCRHCPYDHINVRSRV
jgi:hypothetical protein